MNSHDLLSNKSFRDLFRFLISSSFFRNRAVKIISDKSYEALVNENKDNRPRRVQEEKHRHLMALLNGFEKAIARGIISRHVQNRLFEVFVENMILDRADKEAPAHAMGFEPPEFLLISPTRKCNLRCTGCYSDSGTGNASLDSATFDRILTEKRRLWGAYFTTISGGEPFLWNDAGKGLLDMVEKHSSNLFMVYTNGTLITEETARRMAQLGNISPAISVEGFEEDTDFRRGKGVHRKIMQAFENLRKHGVPFGISTTPTKHNWKTITSDKFVDLYFEKEGAVYGWMFQYMPIGRGGSTGLMVPPAERVEMLKRMRRLVGERNSFIVDFWNSGIVSSGCISAGRPGGYFHIDWNGDITPCAFVPYADGNIHEIYANGGNLNDALKFPFFSQIRQWQNQYGYAQPAEKTGNWMCPCIFRDHFDKLSEMVNRCGARPVNAGAGLAITDPDYREEMIKYGQEIQTLTAGMWKEEFAGKVEKPLDQLAVK